MSPEYGNGYSVLNNMLLVVLLLFMGCLWVVVVCWFVGFFCVGFVFGGEYVYWEFLFLLFCLFVCLV